MGVFRAVTAGNVRELKNIIERAAYRDTTSQITPADLGLIPQAAGAGHGGSFQEKMDAFGRGRVTESLRKAHGNQAVAARDLGLTYHQFRYYLKKYVGRPPR